MFAHRVVLVVHQDKTVKDTVAESTLPSLSSRKYNIYRTFIKNINLLFKLIRLYVMSEKTLRHRE